MFQLKAFINLSMPKKIKDCDSGSFYEEGTPKDSFLTKEKLKGIEFPAWEKGTVENTIGLVRQYIPKKTDLSKITKADLNWIAWELNNRPRKKLGFYTPSEIFYREAGWVT